MTTEEIVLEYLRVILSAPPLGFGAVSLIILVFRRDLKALIGRVASIKFPGGEVSTSQIERAAEETSTERLPEAEPKGAPAPALPEGLTLTPDQQQRIVEVIQAERGRAALWEYRYLNFYLVLHTQRVLDWLVGLPQRTTTSGFDTFWTPLIGNPEERKAVIRALASHHLIQITGDLIEVTPKGLEYVRWRGPLHPPAMSRP